MSKKIVEKKEEEVKYRENVLTIVFYNGAIGSLVYKIDENVDDYIQEDFKQGWKANDIWMPQDWVDFEMKIGEETVNEIDMRKVIGANYW